MAQTTLSRGDVVKLQGIGPEMVFLFEIAEERRKWYDAPIPISAGARCIWFDALNRKQFGVFPFDLLQRICAT